MILNLAVFFTYHVLWPEGDGDASKDPAIGIAAFVALWRYTIGTMTVSGACALLGAILALTGMRA